MVNPTGYTALDFIGFTDKGAYAANVNYVKNDLVHYGGNIWRVLVDDTIGITPAEGTSYTLFIGEPTNLVERIIAPLEENPATIAYGVGRQIIYNNYLYEVVKNIAVGDILVAYEDDPTNANIKRASPVETQVLALNASKVNKNDVVNNVTTTTAGKVLDARQGKVLQDAINTKVNKSDVVNNVTTTAEGKVLDARQGKVLQNGINTKVNKSDIANNVTTTAEGKVLDARQGKALQDGKADNSVIAPVESGTTASRAYAAGAHFIRDSAFCTVKTAISQGEAFTLNTNYTAEDIGSVISALNNDIRTVVDIPTGIEGVICKKVGRIVTCSINIFTDQSASSAGWQTLGTLPSIYKPLEAIRWLGFDNNATSLDKVPCLLSITYSGQIKWYAMGADSRIKPNSAISYISKD